VKVITRIPKKYLFLIPENQGTEDYEQNADEKDRNAGQSFDGEDDLRKEYPDRVPAKGTANEPDDQENKSCLIHKSTSALFYDLLI
jgi:hypothetical protein